MKVGGYYFNGTKYKYTDAYITPSNLLALQVRCKNYEKDLAQKYNINIKQSERAWKQELRDALNKGYGTNQRVDRNGRPKYSNIESSPEELYKYLTEKTKPDEIANYLFGSYSSFSGAKDLATTIEKNIKDMQTNPNTTITVDIVMGNIDEFISSFFRGVQYKDGKIYNTDKERMAFPCKVKYDIVREVKDINTTLYWENKKGLQSNYEDSRFAFGSFSTIEAFIGDKEFEPLRQEIMRVIYEGAINQITYPAKAWRYKSEMYIKLATEYIAWRMSDGNILFTNSKGDINFGSDILNGFINKGKLEVSVNTNYTGDAGEDKINKADKKYLSTYEEEAKKHVEEITDAVVQRINHMINRRLQIKVNYGYNTPVGGK